jgi:3-phosphoshikimate 1-carboxyvinyltransferase
VLASDAIELLPPTAPVDAVVVVPGSKSFTNRALIAAALATGRSVLRGALAADDTAAMCDVLRTLGVRVMAEDGGRTLVVDGCGGRVPATAEVLHGRSAGTVARFVPPLLALGTGDYVLDGSEQMRARPVTDLVAALQAIGVGVEQLGAHGHLPVRITGAGGKVAPVTEVSGAVSSQFASGLMLAAPCFEQGLELTISGALVSRPYLGITLAVMRSFGAHAELDERAQRVRVAPGGYRACEYTIEPDASAASYFFAAAAITGGRVVITGLGSGSPQGDLGFVHVLEQMGCTARMESGRVELIGTDSLTGVDVDLRELSDTVPTLAAVAPFARTPTRIRGIGFIRAKETDRIGAVVRELQRAGIDAREEPDGLVIHPGEPQPCRIETYDDHRMAMAFALLGLRTPGLQIADPGCVRKTYPHYFDDLAAATNLTRRPASLSRP